MVADRRPVPTGGPDARRRHTVRCRFPGRRCASAGAQALAGCAAIQEHRR
jgi:hypothetical protein